MEEDALMTRFPPRIKLLLEDAQLHMTLFDHREFHFSSVGSFFIFLFIARLFWLKFQLCSLVEKPSAGGQQKLSIKAITAIGN